MNMIKFSMLMLALGIQSFSFAQDPEPYQSVRNLSHVPYYVDDGHLVLERFNAINGTVFIEVGSSEANEARFLAKNLPEEQQARIYVIHDWLDNDTRQFQRFLSNVKQDETAHRIIPIRMSSSEASAALNLDADMIYLQSYSGTSLYYDILLWTSHLSLNGVICGNNWTDTNIAVGVTRAAADLGLTLLVNGNFWSLERN